MTRAFLTSDASDGRTSIEPLLELHHLAVSSADTIDALLVEAVLLDCLAALHDDRRYVDVVSRHLFGEADTKGRPAFIREVRMREAWRATRVMEGRNRRELPPDVSGWNDNERKEQTHEAFVLWSSASRPTRGATAVGVHVGLHPHLEIRTIVNRFHSCLQTNGWQNYSVSVQMGLR